MQHAVQRLHHQYYGPFTPRTPPHTHTHRFASATAFMMAALTSADKYHLSIEAGVDAAFMVALAALADELFNDKEG